MVRAALAVALFKSGVISAGFAARMADKPLPQMLTLFSSLGIPITAPNAEDGREDMQIARQWLKKVR